MEKAGLYLFIAGCMVSLSCNRLFSSRPDGYAPIYPLVLVQSYPHDPHAFTQGLQYHDGFFYESTGLYGRSSLRQVDPASGRVRKRVELPSHYFGEGLAIVDERAVVLTWHSGVAFSFDLANFSKQAEFAYEGEGWGLAYDGVRLIMSDGTDRLRFFDPATFTFLGDQSVRDGNRPVTGLNELAWVRNEIWANVWMTDRIACIHPDSGQVVAWLDGAALARLAGERGERVDVMNGIAYDAEEDRLFITGKLWPRLFEVRVGSLD